MGKYVKTGSKSGRTWLILFLAAASLLVFFRTGAVSADDKTIHVIPVTGTVEPGMAAFIKRSVDEILAADQDALIVLKLDSFGGRVDAALEIVETLLAIPMGQSISFVEKRAISAGALIALAGNVLVMKENTLIGDCAPIIQTSEGQKEMGEKTQTVLRAQFRTLAKKNGYPEVLAESMVTKSMEVYQVTQDGETVYMDNVRFNDLTEAEKARITKKMTVVAEGELLTMDDVEARNLGFSRASVRDLDQALAHLGYENYTLAYMTESWSESLVRFLQPLLPILMLVGLGALYTEIKAPGFGIFGVIGIVCLGLVFLNQYLVGLADYTELLLLIIGTLLMAVEILVLPGFGVAGIAGILVLGAGLVLSFQGFVVPDPKMPWEGRLLIRNLAMVVGAFAGALVFSLLMLRFVLPGLSRLIKGPYLEATLGEALVGSDEAGFVAAGQSGIAVTALRPSGKIRVGPRKIDAITRGEFIDPGTPVTIDALEQNRVVVKAADTDDIASRKAES
ncbi:MAG: ATP-dependent Clp protease proteolytic subunit [Desulfotignum sp.]|jgi:membrane-bound serine protease (ClpP class)|nr:ATP-dependent Clp protease proteolytic subunit [Desulfotignum sp.]